VPPLRKVVDSVREDLSLDPQLQFVGSGPITLVGSGPINFVNVDLALKQAALGRQLLAEIKERGRLASEAGAAARREHGKTGRLAILAVWDALAQKGVPRSSRAAIVGRRFRVTSRWVRTVVAKHEGGL